MVATCYSNSEPFICIRWYCRLISLTDVTLVPLPTGYVYEGPGRDSSTMCACSTIGYSLLSACVACQEQTPSKCDHIMPSSQFPGAYRSVLPLAGLHIRTTARLFHLLHSEIPLVAENLLHLTLLLFSRFPNPVPAGTRVPRWALLDVTVCLKFFLPAPK